MPDPTTTIAGTQYTTKLLRGREARTVGLLVTAAALRGIAVAIGKADLSKILKQLPEFKEAPSIKILANLSWQEVSSALGGLADGGATLLEMIGPDGIEVISNAFTAQCTVYVPSPVAAAAGQVFPTPLSNDPDYWVGKWPAFLQWLLWQIGANGFFPDWRGLAASPKPATGSAGASAAEAPTASA